MSATKLLAVAATMAAIVATPAWALPGNVHGNPGHGKQGSSTVTTTPGPNASLPAKAKAYGVACKKESKKHVAGQKGTPFSQCVTAMAKLATGVTSSPAKACKTLSKKHVAGQKGTPYSQCVSAAAKLKASTHH
jgi:hypothetical protein